MRKPARDAFKVAEFPSGIRLDRLAAMTTALMGAEARPGCLSVFAMADGGIAVYRNNHGWEAR